MLGTVSLILVVMWAIGMMGSYTMGGFIHILLLFALVTVLLQVISGRRLV